LSMLLHLRPSKRSGRLVIGGSIGDG
jgi:hypothetical protein